MFGKAFFLTAAEAVEPILEKNPTSAFWDKVKELVATFGGRILSAIAVLIVGSFVVKLLSKGINKALGKTRLDPAVKKILEKFVKALLYVILIIAVVDILGVSMSSVIAILASCGLAVGLALQGALTNLAGGLMILIFKPFRLEDYVEGSGVQGVVKDISIFYTTLLTLDNKKVLVPNGDLMNATITNYSSEPIRRVDVDYKITNDADAEQVKRVLLEACANTELILAEPAPFTRMTAVDDDTYIFTVRGWCKTADYWDAYFNTVENCSKALQDNGIDDPEERIVVRLQKEDA
ncbi:MAG: mechanosensitive ion channel [Oscillospiraceae bacterium]|nr:mechanosensitive ion channel [Oscillospiraceae bacterium]MBR7009952.1 mechanosensitive ion channel [Oscillospiraceae bacterium]